MADVTLPGSGRVTSRLGFGASRIIGGPAQKHSLGLLETAYEAGIRHFDVAPAYGSGGAEEVLGSFLRRHHDEVTVTSKFGIARPVGGSRFLHTYGRAAARFLLWRLPGVKARLIRATQPASLTTHFTSQELSASLRESLTALRSERLDLFLLHEAELQDLTDELRETLDRSVTEGVIGAWGIGSERSKVDRVVTEAPSVARVLQFEWSVLSESPPTYPHAFVITHRALSSAFTQLRTALSDPERCRRWSNAVDLDLGNERVLAQLMLSAALEANPNGIVLFSSNQQKRIRDNAMVENTRSEPAIRRFSELIDAERGMLLR